MRARPRPRRTDRGRWPACRSQVRDWLTTLGLVRAHRHGTRDGVHPPGSPRWPVPGQRLWTSLHHHDGSGTVLASRNGTEAICVPRENRAVPTRLPLVLPGGTGESSLAEATDWPGHASSHAPRPVTIGTGWELPPQVTVTAPTTWPAVATATRTTAFSEAVRSAS